MRTFSELFVGRDDCYGSYTIPKGLSSSEGKLKGSGKTIRQPPTQEIYDAHLAGEKSLGIVPIRKDNTVMWFVIDVDTYVDPELHKDLLKKVYKHNLPLVMTKSKSGGAHLWCFFTHPCDAQYAIDTGKKYLKKLNLPAGTEIFPKQAKTVDVGNWINLPYFGETRVGVVWDPATDKINLLNLIDFEKLANDSSLDPVDIVHSNEQTPTGSDAPPCIDRMEEEGVEAGGRDNALFHVAGYMKKVYPDEWQDKVGEWNGKHVHPPLSFSEIMRICASNENTDYGYSCDKAPMCDLCDKTKCLSRKYGIGTLTGEEFPFSIDEIRKLDTEVPVFFVTLEGEEFKVDGEDILLYSRFKMAVFMNLNKVLPIVKQPDWEEHLRGLMSTHFVSVEAPSISGEAGIIVHILYDWLNQQGQDESKDKARSGRPYIQNGRAYFQGSEFIRRVRKQYPQAKPHNIWSALTNSDKECQEKEGLWNFSCPNVEVRKTGAGF